MKENSRPLVSVVTPAYNQASYLSATIESVLSQDYPHIEYRVIDDGSTDRTPEILESYKGRVPCESHANQGQTATINKGWAQSQGAILTWLNSDDTFLPGAVSKAVAFFSSFRDLTASGFWSSKVGVDDLRYIGNTYVREWKGCPDEALKKLGVSYEAD